MQKKRDKYSIIFDMLSAILAKGGLMKPTHLMYRSNLSSTQMKLYLGLLTSQGLVDRIKVGESECIAITDKGKVLHENLTKFREFEAEQGISL